MSKKEKGLIFIPYQDTDNFFSDGILTREFAILYLLWKHGVKEVINVKKPRTFLDRKHYQIKKEFYPTGTVERMVFNILQQSKTVQYLPFISIDQVIKRRVWWNNGYKKICPELRQIIDKKREYLVYSDNPFAVELLIFLKSCGCKIYFDVMDNFVIHPSLNDKEHKSAFECYKKIFTFADCISANSQQTCDFMKSSTDKVVNLVKNGVFAENECENLIGLEEIKLLKKKKSEFNKCVGYIGKLGLRLDADLIDYVSCRCKDTLFVFVGGYLKGQINEKLLKIFNSRSNVLHINAVPSAYVYTLCNEFDILSIPHSIGVNENGGDPLKLYQYMTRKKAIISTPILGVDEFKD